MTIEFHKLLKIDNESGLSTFAAFENQDKINEYAMRILNKCATDPVERRYKFSDTLITTKSRIEKLAANDDIDVVSQEMGNHLAEIEKQSNESHSHLKGKIPTGVLLVAVANMQTDENDYKLILIKCDYDEFIAEGTGVQSTGLSIKNQIFKTCIYNFKRINAGIQWGEITVSDSTKRCASYWHSSFLELVEKYSNEANTKTAFDIIKRQILNPIKQDHKPDYLILYNRTIGYMRSEGTFDLDYYKNEIIGAYTAYDHTLDVDGLKTKVEKLRDCKKFDATFSKVPSVITDKVKDVIRLTDELELKIRHNIDGIENIVLTAEIDGKKGMTIISQEGYDFAKGLKRQ